MAGKLGRATAVGSERAATAWLGRLAALRLVPHTLRGRLAVTYAFVVAAVVVVFGFVLAQATRDAYVDGLAGNLYREARLIGQIVQPLLVSGAGIDRIDPIAKQAGAALAARVTIVGADGQVLGDSAGDPRTMANQRDRPDRVFALHDGSFRTLRGGDAPEERSLSVTLALPDTGGAVARVGAPLAEIDRAVGDLQNLVLVATVIAATLVAAVGVGVASRIGRPLEDLRRQASAVAEGRLDVTVEPAGTRELGELGRGFNAMTRRLSASLDEAERARGRLEVTLANLTDGVVIADRRGEVVRLNAAARQMLAASGPAAGQPFVAVARDHELDALMRTALAGTGGEPVAATVHHGRSRRALEVTVQSLEAAGERLGLMVLRDVTELRRLEGVRREFVANVSHELRTPLASIRALVETLEAGAVDDPAVANDFLRRIVGEVDRLALLVDELLDLARLESGRVTLRLEALDPGDLIARGVERLRPQVERARLALAVDVEPELPPVRADRARIEQVLLNLVHNAIKFTPPGGRIAVSARADGSFLRVAVADNGRGVAPDELPRLFERFYKADKSRRSEGTGLGLAIAKHIVQAHGGAIWADSEPGAGATFTFTLPLVGEALTPSRHPQAGPRPDSRERGDGSATGVASLMMHREASATVTECRPGRCDGAAGARCGGGQFPRRGCAGGAANFGACSAGRCSSGYSDTA